MKLFAGERDAFGNIVTKDNKSVFAELTYKFNNHNLSFGARQEKVDYEHKGNTTFLKNNHQFFAKVGNVIEKKEKAILFI